MSSNGKGQGRTAVQEFQALMATVPDDAGDLHERITRFIQSKPREDIDFLRITFEIQRSLLKRSEGLEI